MKILSKRTIVSGDPRPWQCWRWMDITGPSEDGEDELYLRRLYLLRTPWFGVMLHWIVREDFDRDALHNHPWTFYRLVLRGGYTEQVAYADLQSWNQTTNKVTLLDETFELHHRAGNFNKFPEGAYHRISKVKPHTMTLVFNGAKTRAWGFFVPGEGHVPWQDYGNGAR